MSIEEKQKAIIDLEYNNNGLNATCKQISNLWNTGKYNEALDLFRSINDDDLKEISIGISWRVPIPTVDQAKWGTDVRIGNRDSIEAVSLAQDKITRNLFVVLVFRQSDRYYYSVNLSTNGGTTWSETALYHAAAFPIVSVSAAVVDSFCYIGYAYDGEQNIGRLRRVRTTTGFFTDFVDGAFFKNVFTLAPTDSVKQVVVSSNQNSLNNRLYYAAITKSDSIKIFWNNPAGVVYNQYQNTFVDAEEGLDLCWNNDYSPTSTYHLFGSYITKSNSIKIFGVNRHDSLKQLTNYYPGKARDHSSVSAQHDTITTVFTYSAGGKKHNRYLVSYNGGATWGGAMVGDTTQHSEAPDIAAGDGGVGIIYRYYTSPREGRFIWRPMAGTWSTPVKYTDHQPFYNKPAIEYLGNKKFGVVYLSWNRPVIRGAYFDMNDMTVGVDDNLAGLPSDFNLLQNYPNPFNPTTLISYQIPTQSNVSIKVYDVLGNLVNELVNEEKAAGSYQVEFNAEKLASGIYFYRLQAGLFVQTKKMVLIR